VCVCVGVFLCSGFVCCRVFTSFTVAVSIDGWFNIAHVLSVNRMSSVCFFISHSTALLTFASSTVHLNHEYLALYFNATWFLGPGLNLQNFLGHFRQNLCRKSDVGIAQKENMLYEKYRAKTLRSNLCKNLGQLLKWFRKNLRITYEDVTKILRKFLWISPLSNLAFCLFTLD